MKSSPLKVEKKGYVWEAVEVPAVHEAALKYEVSLEVPERKKPDLKVICFKSDDVMEQVAELKIGLSAGIVDALGKDLGVSRKELCRISGMAERTLIRKIQEGRLSPDQSERMARLAGVFERAVEVLGSKARAAQWLKTVRPQFRGKAPLDLADTELGCREIMNLLGRIEHGVFS